MNDLYAILGVSPEASGSAIKAAYRDLAKQSHPDLHLGDDEAENRTKEINHAYTVLSDPEKRAAYDEELALLAVKRRKVSFMNASAIAAGLAAFAVTAVALTMTVSVAWRQGEPASLASSSQTGTAIGETPESAVANSGTAVPETPQGNGLRSVPAQEIANAKPETPEAAHSDGAAEARVRITSADPAVPKRHDGAFQEPRGAAYPALPGITPAAKAGSISSSLLALATGMHTREAPSEQASLILAPRLEAAAAPEVASAKPATAVSDFGRKPVAALDRSAVRRERAPLKKASRKSGERTSALETASFVPPLAQDSEPAPWVTARRTTALSWRSADEPFGGLR